MKNRILLKITMIFFLLMAVFTVLSQISYARGTAVVTTAKPESRVITHRVAAEGRIRVNRETAVHTEAGLRVSSIFVNEGERISAGDVLFEIDREDLEEKITELKQDLEMQELQLEDLKSAENARESRRSNSIGEAEENAALRESRADAQLARAGNALDEAKKARREAEAAGEDYGSDEVENMLRRAVTEAEIAKAEAEQELESLKWRIEYEAEEAGRAAEDLEYRGLITEYEAEQESESMNWLNEHGLQETGDPDTWVLYSETYASEEMLILPEDTEMPGEEIPDEYLPAPETEPAIFPDFEPEADAGETEEEARASHQAQLEDAMEKVNMAEAALADANSALSKYLAEEEARRLKSSAETKNRLNQAVASAYADYEDALRDVNEASVTGNRSIQTALLPEGSDSSAQIAEITVSRKRLTLEKLEKIREEGGKIRAPGDGIITSVNLETGGMTGDTAAVRMDDISSGCFFEAEISGEQEKYVGTGDLVVIISDDGKIKEEGIPLTSLAEDGTAFRVTAQLPDGAFAPGMKARLEYTKKSQAYRMCVPVSAIHLDGQNQAYVLVPEEYRTVMGTEMRADKVIVDILEKNESFAALEEGVLSASDPVIVEADRAVAEGSRVRIE